MMFWKPAQPTNVGGDARLLVAKRLIDISAPSWNQLANDVAVVPKGGKLKKNEGRKGAEQSCPEKFGQWDQSRIFKLSF